jgi:hypothetical protein
MTTPCRRHAADYVHRRVRRRMQAGDHRAGGVTLVRCRPPSSTVVSNDDAPSGFRHQDRYHDVYMYTTSALSAITQQLRRESSAGVCSTKRNGSWRQHMLSEVGAALTTVQWCWTRPHIYRCPANARRAQRRTTTYVHGHVLLINHHYSWTDDGVKGIGIGARLTPPASAVRRK